MIDADTRKHLGEYYTPDWLAEGIIEATVTEPLEQRVLDPACGSGTFVFWAVRRYLRAAEAAGMSEEEAILGVVSHVAGMDLHPVAVALARVTYLLAIGSKYLEGERPPFSVPVYLGDSLRWEQDETLFARGGITIFTTDQAELVDRELHFPERVIADADRFDQLVAELANRASTGARFYTTEHQLDPDRVPFTEMTRKRWSPSSTPSATSTTNGGTTSGATTFATSPAPPRSPSPTTRSMCSSATRPGSRTALCQSECSSCIGGCRRHEASGRAAKSRRIRTCPTSSSCGRPSSTCARGADSGSSCRRPFSRDASSRAFARGATTALGSPWGWPSIGRGTSAA